MNPTKESDMNRKSMLAIAVGAALTASAPFIQAQQNQPGPYALPAYLQTVEKDRAALAQDRAKLAGDRQALGKDLAERRKDGRELRHDEHQLKVDRARLRHEAHETHRQERVALADHHERATGRPKVK